MAVFGYDVAGEPTRNAALARRVDYLDGYCRAVNAALGREPEVGDLSWHERGWLGRLLRWLRL